MSCSSSSGSQTSVLIDSPVDYDSADQHPLVPKYETPTKLLRFTVSGFSASQARKSIHMFSRTKATSELRRTALP